MPGWSGEQERGAKAIRDVFGGPSEKPSLMDFFRRYSQPVEEPATIPSEGLGRNLADAQPIDPRMIEAGRRAFPQEAVQMTDQDIRRKALQRMIGERGALTDRDRFRY